MAASPPTPTSHLPQRGSDRHLVTVLPTESISTVSSPTSKHKKQCKCKFVPTYN